MILLGLILTEIINSLNILVLKIEISFQVFKNIFKVSKFNKFSLKFFSQSISMLYSGISLLQNDKDIDGM